MNIGNIPYQTFPSIGYAISASQTGRMSVPVSPSTYIYSHFKHVSGVPAPDGVEGVNINRLKILDTLIEQLAQMKKQPEPSFKTEELDLFQENQGINVLIDQYQEQIRMIQEQRAKSPYALASPPTGAVFSILV
jgi:hypothetical protein